MLNEYKIGCYVTASMYNLAAAYQAEGAGKSSDKTFIQLEKTDHIVR